MKNEFQKLLDTQLSALEWSQAKSEELLRQTRGEIKVKKKLRLSLVVAVVLVLLTATAFALYALHFSPQAGVISQARRALTDKYGLSPEAFGLFSPTAAQDGGKWVVRFTANDGLHPALLGDYAVTLENGQAAVSWTHDDVDPALWQSGDLASPAWGQPQIQKALRGDPQAAEIKATLWKEQPPAPVPQVTPSGKPLPGQIYWKNQWVTPTTPPESSLAQEEALALAKEVLAQEYSLPQEELEKAELVDGFYFPTQDGPPIWSLHFYLVHDGVEWGCGVVLNGETGEVLSVGSSTGGNG